MDLGLRGKTAVVTAASKGMGRACAMALAAEGARVAICARNEADITRVGEEIRAKTGAEVMAERADVTSAADVKAFVGRVIQALGGVDILVANAGGPPRGGLGEMSDAQWHAAFDVTIVSVVRLIREVLPSMQARGWGRVLTIQSTSVKQPVEGLLLSNATRPAIAGLMKTLVPELGAHNITFNVVCPGAIMTDRFLGGATQAGEPVEEYVRTRAALVPLRRIGTPEEFASVVTFLASERASYVTGVALQVDGGVIRGLL
jgi:3-oxoacyl-[acyl-carrier protein] reductase